MSKFVWPYLSPTIAELMEAGEWPVEEVEMKWQDIASAPKDGSFLVFANFKAKPPEYEIGRYDPQTWKSYVPAGDGLFRQVEQVLSEWTDSNHHRATHWMPLPEAPQ